MSKNTRKVLLVAMAALLLVVMSVGGTLAWLMDTTNEVTNTFKPTNIDVTLDETKPENKTALVIPGVDIAKDPKVTAVSTEGVAYYIFIEITDNLSNLTDTDGGKMLSYEIASGWNPLGTNTYGAAVYYYLNSSSGDKITLDILKDNVVKVSSELTDEQMASLETMGTLSFKAYVIQSAAMADAATAYATASGNTLDTTAEE